MNLRIRLIPCRPNPIGLSVVRLLGRKGNVLEIEDVDLLDGTPLLDVKPYVPRFDRREEVRCGWLDAVDEEEAARRGRRDCAAPPPADRRPE